MAYRRHYKKKVRSGRRFFSKHSGGSLAKRVKYVLQKVAEKKFKDCYIQTAAGVGAYAAGTAFLSMCMATGGAGTGIIQGAGDGARLGDSININSINLKYQVYNTQAATAVPTNIRCMILCDTAQFAAGGGTAPTVADVFESTANIWSPVKDVAYQRFRIIYDKIHTCSAATGGPNAVRGQFYKKFRLSPANTIHFTGNTGNITDAAKNTFYMMFFTDVATATHTAYCRMRFTDPQ